MTKPSNPLAFPIQHTIVDTNDPFFKLGQSGMSLRDYFASKALISQTYNTKNPQQCREIAEFCYSIADAMLAQRKVDKGS